MLFEPGGDGQDVGIEDDVGRIESRLLGQQPVGPLADRHLPLDGVGLAFLVERHDDDAGAELADRRRLLQEVRFAFLQADRVDDRLALHALQARDEDRPFRAVDDDRHARDFRLGGDEVQELRDRALGLEHALVHVDVDQVGAAAHLIERDRGGLGKVVRSDQPRELRGAADVGPLADHLEIAVGTDRQHLEPRELGRPRRWRPSGGIRGGRPITALAIARM